MVVNSLLIGQLLDPVEGQGQADVLSRREGQGVTQTTSTAIKCPNMEPATDFFECRLHRNAASTELTTMMEVLTSEILQLRYCGSSRNNG